MKILFSSYLFPPSVGGIESVSKILAEKFASAGIEVQVVTETAGDVIAGPNYRVTRRPSLAKLFGLLRWCDLFFQNNREFGQLLLEKKVPHEFRELPGEHNWTFWDAQVEEFLLDFAAAAAQLLGGHLANFFDGLHVAWCENRLS